MNVLRSCSKVPSVKRVVVTLSMATVEVNGRPLTPEVLIDESWFSDPVVCKELKVCTPHYLRKKNYIFSILHEV